VQQEGEYYILLYVKKGNMFHSASINKQTKQYTIKQADGLMIKSGGHDMIHISQWLKFGRGKLLSDSGMQTFL
jgi:hypothetical protein